MIIALQQKCYDSIRQEPRYHTTLFCQEKVIDLPDETPPELRALFGSILAKDPSKRATIDQLKRDPWVLEGLDQDELVSPVITPGV